MKLFYAFVRKEFYHIFRDKRTVLILLVMPIVQILLFGFAITTEVKDTRIAVLDLSKDAVTQDIKQRFEASPYFSIAQEVGSPTQIEEAFKNGEIGLALVFGEHFAGELQRGEGAQVQLIADGTDPNQASMFTGYATGILSSIQQELSTRTQGPFRIVPQVKMLYNPQSKSAYNFVPGVMGLILMLICAMMTSIAIVREKETGTMEVLLASPMKPLYIILAKAMPYFTLSLINLTTILLLSVYVLGVPIAGSLSWLVLVSLLFIFLALALGLFISTMVETQMAAMLASGMGLMMPVMLLSGMMFPIESMPKALQWLSCLVPARWYIAAVKKIMIQGVDIQFVAKEVCILAAMAITLIILSLKKFKIRLN